MKRTIGVITTLALSAVLIASCSSTPSGPPTTASTPQYQHEGSYQVGVTTIDLGSAGTTLGERFATVFYPSSLTAAQAASTAKFSYTQSETIPTSLQGILPAKYNTVTTINAHANAPGSTKGPFPVVLFSHGYGGQRLYYSHVLAGMASWGYVVVSADYLERGIAAQALRLTTKPSATQDQSIMASSLSVLLSENTTAGSVLRGLANPKKVAAVGHSAGGGTALTALNVPAIQTAVGWAPVPPSGTPVAKPVMLIGAQGDNAVTPKWINKTYNSFTGPKSFIEISGEGHDSYTDTCQVIREGGGLISFALANHFVTPELAKLAVNGCQASNIAPAKFWPIVQYYTLFQIATVFSGHNAVVPIPAAGTFPGFTVKIVQHGT
jgi:dienelactone hydrolase